MPAKYDPYFWGENPIYTGVARKSYLRHVADTPFIERTAIVQACLLPTDKEARDAIETPPSAYLQEFDYYGAIREANDRGIGQRCFDFLAPDRHGYASTAQMKMTRSKQRLQANTHTWSFSWNDRQFRPRIQVSDAEITFPEAVRINIIGGSPEKLLPHPVLISSGLAVEEYDSAITSKHGVKVDGVFVPVLRIRMQHELLTLNQAYAEIERLYEIDYAKSVIQIRERKRPSKAANGGLRVRGKSFYTDMPTE